MVNILDVPKQRYHDASRWLRTLFESRKVEPVHSKKIRPALEEMAEIGDLDLSSEESTETRRLRDEFYIEIEARKEGLERTQAYPVLSHYTPIQNLQSMIGLVASPDFGRDALRLRSWNLNCVLEVPFVRGVNRGGEGQYSEEVSFFVAGSLSPLIEQNGRYVVDPTGDNYEKVALGSEERALLIMPWHIVLQEDVLGIASADKGELQPVLSTLGTREEKMRRGISIHRPDILIIVHKEKQETIEQVLSGIEDPDLREELQRQILFLDDDEIRNCTESVAGQRYFNTLIDHIVNASGGLVQRARILDVCAMASRFDPLDLSPDRVGFNSIEHLKRVYGEWRPKIESTKKALFGSFYQYTFYHIYRRLCQQGNFYPTKEEFFDEALKLAEEITYGS